MALKYVELRAGNNMSASQSEAFRSEKIDAYGQNGIKGFMIDIECTNWIVIEGDENDIDAEVTNLQNDSRLTNLKTVDSGTLSSLRYSKFYAYFECNAAKCT